MSNIVVVYHSGYGHTQRMAQSVAQGAGAELVAIDAEGNVGEQSRKFLQGWMDKYVVWVKKHV